MGVRGRRRHAASVIRLSWIYAALTLDAVGGGLIHFHPHLTSPIDPLDVSFQHPGSTVFDVWLLGLFRVVGFLISALVFDCSWSSAKKSNHEWPREASQGSGVSGHEAEGPPMQAGEWWAETVASITCTISILAIVAKCLVRLIVGTSAEFDSCLWFWLSIGFGVLMSLVDHISLRYHVRWVQDMDEEESRERDELNSPLLSEEGRNLTRGGGGEPAEDEVARRQRKKKKTPHSATLQDLLSLIRPDWHLVAFAFIFLLAAAVCQVMIPHFTGKIMDTIVSTGSGDSKEEFSRYTTYLVVAAAACGVFTGLRGGIFTVIGTRVNARIREMLFRSLLKQEIGFYDTTKTGEISSRLNSDTTKVGDQVSLNVNFFLRNFVQAVGTLIFMFAESWKLSLTAFISVPVIVFLSTKYGAYIRSISKQTQERLAEANSVAEEALSTMATIRYFACEKEEEDLYHKKLSEYTKLSRKEGTAYSFYACATVLMPQCVTALVLFYGGKLVIEGEITSGKLVSFLLYLSSLSDAFNSMGSIFSALTQALGAADKVFELIKRDPKITPRPDGALAPHDCIGRLELKQVVFRYPARPGIQVLNNLSMVAEPGQVVALVGPSGGGKSSCISLIEHLYEPEQGEVLLDGKPVWAYEHHWYHRHVSIVGQEPILYGRSIKRNIIFGLEGTPYEPSDEEIRHAAMLANANDFIMNLPDGYETEVGERGVCLSGGQKQRVAIARALARKPRVLLLDEATSALDAESEHLVQQAIDNMISLGGMTVVIIAHRLSTILTADKILVVKGGVVVEEGRHDQLIKAGGVYAQLVAKQMGGGLPPPPSGL